MSKNNKLKRKFTYASSLALSSVLFYSHDVLANETLESTVTANLSKETFDSKENEVADNSISSKEQAVTTDNKSDDKSSNLSTTSGESNADKVSISLVENTREEKKETSKTLSEVAKENSKEIDTLADKQSKESNDIISVQPLWDSKMKGQGKVVAVIDTGLDINHDVLRISDVTKAKFKNANEIEKAKLDAGISYGRWFSEKVVFGYNYADANDSLKQKDVESHGMHVAGIAIGNPSQKHSSGNYIYGVAPEAQLMFMRVFSDKGGGTSPYLYAKAIEDAIKLGADTINLSLGSANGILNDTSKTIEAAINKANAAGITVVIAAGNDTVFGEGHAKPDADKPDYGLVGDPAVAREGISVASFNNTHVTNELLTIKGTEDTTVIFSRPSVEPVYFDPTKEYEYIYAGKGTEDELKALGDLTGKIALIERGDINFGDKIRNAHQYKAVGAIIFNNTDGDAHSVRMTLKEEDAKIPSLFIDRAAGKLLIEKSKTSKHTILIDGKHGLYTNPKADQMSDFSSWGLSADGELKPDLAAPGGDIFSSINDNRYATMGGTSMATPHVAGVSVLMKQALEERFPNLKGKDQTTLIKHLLMSTAMPHVNKETNATTSPRQQGAGIINVSKAISSDLYVTGDEGLSSISLGNVDERFTFNVTLHNLSDKEKTVKYITEVTTDQVEAGKFTLKPRKLLEVAGELLTIAANGSVKIPISIDTSNFTQDLTNLMKNGYYLEGFVKFLNTVDNAELVSIPYVGFKGKFQDLAVIEKPVYDFKKGENPFYADLSKIESYEQENESNYTALLIGEKDFNHLTNEYTATKALTAAAFKDAKGKYVIRRDAEGKPIIAISPNGDGNRDALAFRGTFLRNYKDLKIAIYKADDTEFTNPLWIGEKASGDKNYYSGNPVNAKSNIIDTSEWTGKDKEGKLLPDGKYKYVVEHYSVVPGAEKQRMVFDVVLDTVAPKTVTGIYDEKTRKFKPREVKEDGVGLLREEMYYVVEKSDNPLDSLIYTDPTRKEYIKKAEDGTYELPSVDLYGRKISDENIWLVTEDFAGNTTRTNLADFKKIGNTSGLVNVRLMDKELNLSLNMLGYRYVIKDETGKVVNIEEKSTTGSHILPFGKYSVELILIDEEFAKLLDEEKSKTISIDENNTELTVDFSAKLVLYSTLTVDFNTELPKGLAVYAVDSKGNRTELTQGRYIKDIFEKRLVYKEKYSIIVETPAGYYVTEKDLTADMVEDRVIKILSLWAKGNIENGGRALEIEELSEFDLTADTDKDGFTNEVELGNGSNPLDEKSVPNVTKKGKSLFVNELPQAATPLITLKGEALKQEAKKEAKLPVVTPKENVDKEVVRSNEQVSQVLTQLGNKELLSLVNQSNSVLVDEEKLTLEPSSIVTTEEVSKKGKETNSKVLPKTSAQSNTLNFSLFLFILLLCVVGKIRVVLKNN